MLQDLGTPIKKYPIAFADWGEKSISWRIRIHGIYLFMLIYFSIFTNPEVSQLQENAPNLASFLIYSLHSRFGHNQA
ncbi:hypothetical protein NIES37_13670 [Tolypothrix tenuis PCC 7101]|uniref:Uncharacterized protein n=1 Tax=Tolypothrix tenuis PCC 7101 TaxID=231146 RepID=A0A1Z4MVB6_9CYAN|nr:hypothetical protein NIES37_13670 [Tolypothrix tenuis PCC 7101]BAZ72066.1 hypothetical protein NIES50_06150 [Aulosira laxa NIES-50]